jgi:catechol 2,3-dioxygenase-like lactoylglutathione lyase family enzyme
MLNAITISHVWVLDQDEALDFYVGKLGLVVTNDQNLGFMRWLTVGVPGQPGRDILLELPGPPSIDEATGQQIREQVTKGATGFVVGFSTDYCRKTYETLLASGVEFTQEPVEREYGIDCGFRDPFGNHIRLVQPSTAARP